MKGFTPEGGKSGGKIMEGKVSSTPLTELRSVQMRVPNTGNEKKKR